MTYYSRKATRLRNYDYSGYNYYFVTICTHNRKCILGKPDQLNAIGTVVKNHVQKIPSYYNGVILDQYVVMPNHVHMIIQIVTENGPTLSQIIGQFKTGVTKEIRKKNPEAEIWQRSFHDHIIRSQESYEKIWLYIEANPVNWEKDCFYIDPNIETM